MTDSKAANVPTQTSSAAPDGGTTAAEPAAGDRPASTSGAAASAPDAATTITGGAAAAEAAPPSAAPHHGFVVEAAAGPLPLSPPPRAAAAAAVHRPVGNVVIQTDEDARRELAVRNSRSVCLETVFFCCAHLRYSIKHTITYQCTALPTGTSQPSISLTPVARTQKGERGAPAHKQSIPLDNTFDKTFTPRDLYTSRAMFKSLHVLHPVLCGSGGSPIAAGLSALSGRLLQYGRPLAGQLPGGLAASLHPDSLRGGQSPCVALAPLILI